MESHKEQHQPSRNTAWQATAHSVLLLLLHPDVIPLSLAYTATPAMMGVFNRKWGRFGDGDGQFQQPSSLCVHHDELFVNDAWDSRIQVFHTCTGRFLRSFGDLEPSRARKKLLINPFRDELLNVISGDQIQVLNPLNGKHIGSRGPLGSALSPVAAFLEAHSICFQRSSSQSLCITEKKGLLTIYRQTEAGFDSLHHIRWCSATKDPHAALGVDDNELFVDAFNSELIHDSSKQGAMIEVRTDILHVYDVSSGKHLRNLSLSISKDHQRRKMSSYGRLTSYGVAVHGNELILWNDEDSLIVVDRSSGTVLRQIGSCGSKEGQLLSPSDFVVLNETHELFVCDSKNRRICVFQ